MRLHLHRQYSCLFYFEQDMDVNKSMIFVETRNIQFPFVSKCLHTYIDCFI